MNAYNLEHSIFNFVALSHRHTHIAHRKKIESDCTDLGDRRHITHKKLAQHSKYTTASAGRTDDDGRDDYDDAAST